ncbi:MAG: hypothetical protein ACI4D3_02865 [Lachnospiraceae bacterium]
MLFILYGGHTGMGYKSREFFRKNGVQTISKYHYVESAPKLTTFYEPRNYVDEITFLKNTDTIYRYSVGNIQSGFNQSQIIEAVSSDRDYLLTLSTDRIDIIKNLKDAYGCQVQVIYVYTDDAALRSVIDGLDVSADEAELRYRIGRTLKECYNQNPSLFDYVVIYGGENSLFDCDNLVNQCKQIYIKSNSQKNDSQYELLRHIKDIKAAVSDMQNTLNRLVCFAENDLQTWLRREKQKLESDSEQTTAAFIAKSDQYINSQVRGADCLVQEETANLQCVFGALWDKFLPATQTSLISAGVLWKLCADINKKGFDFSGIIIAATSALESELKRVFYTGFQEFMVDRYGNPETMAAQEIYAVWPERLLFKTKKEYAGEAAQGACPAVKLGNSFTMGTLPFMFYDRNKAKRMLLQLRLKEYLRTIVCDDYYLKPLKAFNNYSDPDNFVRRCEQVRGNYRNPAAHTAVIDRGKAVECYSQVIGKVDSFRHLVEVQGLLMMLYSYLK